MHLTLTVQSFDRYTTNSWLIFRQQSMIRLLAKCQLLYRPIYLPIAGRYVDHHSADILVDTSVDTLTDISQLLYQPRVGRYVDQDISRHSADMLTDTSVKCRLICRQIYRSRGAQNTHDLPRVLGFMHHWQGHEVMCTVAFYMACGSMMLQQFLTE